MHCIKFLCATFLYYALVYINYWNFLKAIHSKMLVFQFLCLLSTSLAKSQISFILYWTLGSFQLQNSKKFSIKYFKRVLFMLVLWIYLFLVTIWMSYTPFISNFYSMTLLYCCHSIGISKWLDVDKMQKIWLRKRFGFITDASVYYVHKHEYFNIFLTYYERWN